MDESTKKAILLLKSLIFHYHGMDEDEKGILEATAKKLDALQEMDWANNYIATDYLSAFERSKGFLKKVFDKMSPDKRLSYLLEVWEDNHAKGYVTEMETTAILALSEEWEIEQLFLAEVTS